MKINIKKEFKIPECEKVYTDICELIEGKGLCSDMTCDDCIFNTKEILKLFIKEINFKG